MKQHKISSAISPLPAENITKNRITFWLNGQELTRDIHPALTTMDFLHHDLNLWGTKCSCNEGDCGACTVVIASAEEGMITYSAVNSCLYTAAKLHGKHLISIEGIGTPDDLHPIQQTMLDFHGTQCGYCTPGFMMAMFALFASFDHPDAEQILAHLEGNLCRCTGYKSILDAAKYISEHYSPADIVPAHIRVVEPELLSFNTAAGKQQVFEPPKTLSQAYQRPNAIQELFDLLQSLSGKEYRFISGGTDIMVQMNINRRESPVLIDLGGLKELNGITLLPDGILIRANATYTEILADANLKRFFPALCGIIKRLASNQIRNIATLAGNIGNASPVADTAPLLLAADAVLHLNSVRGWREVPLRNYYLDYKQTAMAHDEFIAAIFLPLPPADCVMNSIKSSRRRAVDIAAITTAISLRLQGRRVVSVVLSVGGADKIPRICPPFSEYLCGKYLDAEVIQAGADLAAADFFPISDVRATADERSNLLRNHVIKYLTEFSQAEAQS